MEEIEKSLKNLQESLGKMETNSSDQLKELFFTSSKRDQVAVDLISKNLVEFSKLTAENGFNLNLQCCGRNEISVVLVQTTPSSDCDEVLRVFNELLETKRKTLFLEENKMVENSPQDEGSLDNKLKELLVAEVANMKNYVDEKLETVIDNKLGMLIDQKTKIFVDKQEQSLSMTKIEFDEKIHNIKYDKEKEARFLGEQNLDFFKESDHLKGKIISYVVNNSHDAFFKSIEKSSYSYGKIESSDVNTLLENLETEKSSSSYSCSGKYSNLKSYVCDQKLSYRPTEKEIIYLKSEFKRKYGLYNTIGTLHFLETDYSKTENTSYLQFMILGMIIVNKRVVAVALCHSRDAVVLELARNPSLQSWTQNVNFAVYAPCKLYHPFLSYSKQEILLENEKAVTWTKNCFKISRVHNDRSGLKELPYAYNFLLNAYCH